MSMDDRFKLSKSNRACFKCFGAHRRKDCKSTNSCSNCNGNYHHSLLCNRQKYDAKVENACHKAVGTIANNPLVQPTVEEIIFAVQEVPVEGLNATALLMYDSGSNSSYIQRIQAKPVRSDISLSIAVLGGKTKNLKTKLYEIKLINQEGKTKRVTAYGIDNITSLVKIPNNTKIAQIFPDVDLQLLYRKSLLTSS